MLTRYLYIETQTNRALEGLHKVKSANNIKLEFKGLSRKKQQHKYDLNNLGQCYIITVLYIFFSNTSSSFQIPIFS